MWLGLFCAPALAYAIPSENPATGEILSAINAERLRLDLPAVSVDEKLSVLAQELALEVATYDGLDFEPPSGKQLLARARSLHYFGPLVQELVSVESSDPCEVVDTWSGSIGLSDAYRRHEVRDIGIGLALRDETPVFVLVTGVPKMNWWQPGGVPRELLLLDLVVRVNRKRAAGGLPWLARSEDLDEEAQAAAFQVLRDVSIPEGVGMKTLRDRRVLLFSKGPNDRASDCDNAVNLWFQRYRSQVLRSGKPRAGAGLASDLRGTTLEAAWALVLAPATN